MGYLSKHRAPSGSCKKVMSVSKLVVGTTMLATLPALSQAMAEQYNIPAQPLPSALKTFANQANMQLFYVYSDVENAQGNTVNGDMDKKSALAQLLRNTNLDVVYRSEAEAVIRPRQAHAVAPSDQENTGGGGAAKARSPASTASASQELDRLEEIVVSSQKRDERLQDVPIPVTAITATALADRNEYRLQDFYTSVPGLQMTPNQLGGTATIAIRGVTTGDFSNPTVGITVDDMPFGSSTVLGGGFLAPDLDPTDLSRIEVLRGPQGTLYGASSVGGLVKYVTTDPSASALSGRVQAGLSSVHGGSQLGYNFSGAINVPLSETFAVRASAFMRRDSGYVDNIQSGEKDVNRTEVKGVHLSALWEPTDNFSLKLGALGQDNKIFGSPYVMLEPGVGDLQQRFLPQSGTMYRKFYAFSANANWTIGENIDLVSVTGYSISKLQDSYDVTESTGGLTALAFNPTTRSDVDPPLEPVPTLSVDNTKTSKFTQELRLSMPLGSKVDWLLGGFFTHERSPWVQSWVGTDADTTPIGTMAHFDFWSTYRDIAVFTDVTFHITDRFNVQVGARESRIKQKFGEVDTGPYVARFVTGNEEAAPALPQLGPPEQIYPTTIVNETARTYLLTPQFKITDDTMVYARFASGYRPGGVNSAGSLVGLSPTFKPDKTKNYEVGIKSSLLDRTLYVEGSIYRIDWQDLQLQQLTATGQTVFTNGGKAKSEGIELSVQSAPLTGLSVGGWVTWNRAVLVQAFPLESIAVGHDGERLPFSSKLSASLSANYEFPLGPFTASVGSDVSYVGRRFGVFVLRDTDPSSATFQSPLFDRQEFPSYTKVDLRGGLNLDKWDVNLFVNNVADKRGILGGGAGTQNFTGFTVIQPRTIGATVARKF